MELSWLLAASIIAGAVLVLALAQVVYVWLYHRGARRPSLSAVPGAFTGKVAVIVCLRGQDPTLEQSLHALGAQVWPDFELHLALDSSSDPAHAIARQFAARNVVPTSVHVLSRPSGRCGLKCDLQRLAYSRLSDAVEFVVFTDADCVTPTDWLARLLQPFDSPSVGAVSGNRWYGHAPGWGSEVRRIWNAAAIVQMYLYRIPWGGALALRRCAIEQAGLIDVWSRTLCEDTVVQRALRQVGLQVAWLPRLALVSQESATSTAAANWIVRQLITARLYHPAWPLVAGHSLLVGSTTLLSLLGILLTLLLGQGSACLLLFAGFAIAQLSNLGLLAWIEETTVPAPQRQREVLETARQLPRQLLLVTWTQLVHSWAALRAASARLITWRGITYQISPKAIEMLDYQPYQLQTDRSQSIF
ncbi:MAG: glycosyltransferase family 2 protein [Planctomycetota bacterium]